MDIINKIKKYKERKTQEEKNLIMEEEQCRNQLIYQIHSIQPDIYNLIKIANEAEDAGIPLEEYKWPVDSEERAQRFRKTYKKYEQFINIKAKREIKKIIIESIGCRPIQFLTAEQFDRIEMLIFDNPIDWYNFIRKTMFFIPSRNSSHIIVGIGFRYDDYHIFFTNGKAVYAKNLNNGEETEAPIVTIENFLNIFLEFQEKFLNYIKKEVSL